MNKQDKKFIKNENKKKKDDIPAGLLQIDWTGMVPTNDSSWLGFLLETQPKRVRARASSGVRFNS
jgi:hypothetical protein